MEKFDLVIIGSGPGGYVAAIRAGQLGLKTALVEKDKELGGTCLNVGCIPSKALLTSSDHFMFVTKEAQKHGIVVDEARVDLSKMQQRKDKVVKTFTGGVRALMKTNKVTTLEGFGTITAPGKVSIKSSNGQTQEIEAKNIIIATGSAPVELPSAKFDGKTIVSSTEALTFTEPPKKFLVVGAGASDNPGIPAANCHRLRSGAVELAAAFADRAGHHVSSGDKGQRGQDRQRPRHRHGDERK
jgi:dihydrolipoamide dehydrogenase